MKKILTLFGTALLAADIFAGVGATTNWVQRYVAEYVANAISNSASEVANNASVVSTNGNTTVAVGSGEYALSASFELVSVEGLTATNVSQVAIAQGITNKLCWAKSGNNFVSAGKPTITKGLTKYSCGTFQTTGLELSDFYSGTNLAFSVRPIYLTESKAKEIRGE